MESFFSGKSSKVTAIFLLMILPRLLTDMILDYDYHAGVIIGAVLTLLFMWRFNKSAAEKIKISIKAVKPSAILAIILTIFAIQFIFLFLSFKTGELTVDNDWFTYEKIIGAIILAPIAEEITFRWALTETCIDSNTSKFKKILFVCLSLIIWNFVHTKSFATVNISVIILGLFFYLFYFKSDNIYYCIIAHISANFFARIMTSPLQKNLIFLCENNISVIISVIILIISTVYFTKINNATKKN